MFILSSFCKFLITSSCFPLVLPENMYQQGGFRMFSNSGVNNYSPGMMPPPRPNALLYNTYNQQYGGPNRSYFVPAAGNPTNFPIEHNRVSQTRPRQIVGCGNTGFVNMNATARPDMLRPGTVSHDLPSTSMQNAIPAAARVANSLNTTPRFGTHQSSATARSSTERDSVQQAIRGQQNVRESPVMANQHYASNVMAINNGETTNTGNEATNKTPHNSANFDFKIYGSTDRERIFMLTGTVERIIKWSKIFRNQFCYFEVIAPVVSIQEGSVNTQKVMLLRDKKGPILQVIYYETTHIDIEDFYIGQMLTCTGRMTGVNIFNALCIRSSNQEEVDSLQRLTQISEQAVEYHLSS